LSRYFSASSYVFFKSTLALALAAREPRDSSSASSSLGTSGVSAVDVATSESFLSLA
jgi:hypothetical protein